MFTAEPIVDVLRGISTVASFTIAFGQVKHVWQEIFTGTCEHCHGAGSVICPRCSGTKDRRSRAAGISYSTLGFVDAPGSHHPCITCGPNGSGDFEVNQDDDEDRAFAIRDDLQLAMVGKPRKSKISILSGTVPCPECHGQPIYKRHTPNFVRFFGLEEPWQFQVAQRMGGYYMGAANRPKARRRPMLEYPGQPPPQRPRIPPIRGKAKKKLGGGVLSGQDQLTMDDYILEFVDDNDSEVDD